MKHKVKLHKWIDGALKWTEHHFNSKHEAIKFAEEADHHVAKIIAPDGSLAYEIISIPLPVQATTDYA